MDKKRYFFFIVLLVFGMFGYSQAPDSLSLISDSVSVVDTMSNEADNVMDDVISIDSAKFKKIHIEFIKKKVVQSADSLYFNICKITNTTSEVYKGNFEVRAPAGWNLIGDPSSGIVLAAGETKIFPIRMSMPVNAVGGIAYVLDVSFTAKDGMFSGVSYIKIPLKSDWDMRVEKNSYYFNEYFDDIQFNIYISNKGNAEELVKLKFEVGKLLIIDEIMEEEIYTQIPPNTDTIFTYSVRRSKLNEEEKHLYKQMWNESMVNVTALSGIKKRVRESIRFVDLDNEYIHERQEHASPLNADFSIFNLLSSAKPRMNMMLFGELLFNGDHDLGYVFQGRNLFYNANSLPNYFNNPNNTTFRIRYKWKDKIKAEIGEVSNYSMHSIRGWGVRGSYQINDKDKVSVSYNLGKYMPTWGINARYDTKIKKVGLYASGTYEENRFLFFDGISTELGSSFSLSKNHSFRASIMGTQAVYDKNQGVGTLLDTTVLGMSYRFSYNGKVDKFRFGVNTKNDQFNYLRIRPSNTIYGYTRFIIDPKNRINATVNYNSIKSSKIVFNPFFNGSYNSQQIFRLTFTHQFNKTLMLETGPSARVLNRIVIDTSSTISSNFDNYFYGLYSLVRIKFNEFNILTPSLSAGVTAFRNRLNTAEQIKPLPTVNIGANFTSRNWGASSRYIYGPNFFLTEGFFDYNPAAFETIYLRANMNRYFYNRKVKLTGYGTYYLRLPANWQNFVASARFDFQLPQRWNAYITGNLFTNSMDEINEGIISHRSFSLNAGVQKSFDIPQPRIKYYDLNVVCFNDFNGNGVREDNEPLLSNIKVKVSMNRNIPNLKGIRFGEKELITDPEGQLGVVDIPEGNYLLEFEPLMNLGNLYNSKGDIQEILMTENMTLQIPYVESFKVKGRVILNRDEYSSNGLINIGGIRVEASTIDGQVFSALTDNEGNYLINVPQAGFYTIKVNNIFGDKFEIDKEEFSIQFNGFKTFNVDFTFFEGKRKVNFGGNNFFNFGSGSGSDDFSSDNNVDDIAPINVDENLMQNKDDLNFIINGVSESNTRSITANIDPNKVKFMVEIGVYSDVVPVEVANKMIELQVVPTPIESAGITIYATQVVATHDEVVRLHKKIVEVGFTQALIVGSYNGKVISEAKAIQYKK